jgi:hypothetical protein
MRTQQLTLTFTKTQVPLEICQIPGLTKLNLADNLLKMLPLAIRQVYVCVCMCVCVCVCVCLTAQDAVAGDPTDDEAHRAQCL